MGYKLILGLLLLAIANAIVPSTNISNPRKNSNVQNRQAVAYTTVPYIVETPDSIRQVAEILVQNGENCTVVNVEPMITKGTYIDLPTNYTEIVRSSWQVQIMSFAYSEASNKIYILLDNGTLMTSQFRTATPQLPFQQTQQTNHNLYARNALGAIDTWFQSQHKLILFQDHLFVLAQEKLWRVNIYEVGYWQKEMKPIKQNVLKVEVTNSGFYILTSTSLFQLVQNQTKLIKSGQKFIDFVITKEFLYLLIKDTGILQADFRQGQNSIVQTLWQIEQPEHATRIRAIYNTVFIVYEIQHKNYLAEYFVKQGQLIINRYYHNYYSIKDIHLSNQYAIIDSYSSYIILHHSINRNSFNDFSALQFLYKSRGTKVTGIQFLKSFDRFSFLLGNKTSITQYNVATNIQRTTRKKIAGINPLVLQCQSEKSKSIALNAVYKGLCNQIISHKQFYCQTRVQMSINFEYSYIRQTLKNADRKIIIWIVLLIFTLFTFIFCLACNKRLRKMHKKMRDDFQRLHNKREQHSITMEQTFNQEVSK